MKKDRRHFIKSAGLAGTGMLTAGLIPGFVQAAGIEVASHQPIKFSTLGNTIIEGEGLNMIGPYGHWAAGLGGDQLPTLSFRKQEAGEVGAWKARARARLSERLAVPNIGGLPEVKVERQSEYDGLHIEELSWQLPYGRPTEAILLKPANSRGKLPAILAFHDHGGNKYFGTRKITRISAQQHPMMNEHQTEYYEGLAWANEIARRGYVVLVADAFPFASRRVMMQDVPEHLREGLSDEDPENPAHIASYNNWAGQHEHIMAKSLFSAGTTWPGVFFAEDRKSLDILCARPDVDATRVGCAGLSGGGMRTVFMGGQDDRIRCAVCVGFMTTWRDFLLNKSFTHTWMTYVPLLPKELDFPEILGLRVPLPTLVLNDKEDQLYTLAEMKRADGMLKEIYQKANAGSNYQCSWYPGPHKFDRAMQREAFDWFDKWLKI